MQSKKLTSPFQCDLVFGDDLSRTDITRKKKEILAREIQRKVLIVCFQYQMLCEQDITACTIRHLNIDGANERDIDTIDTVERSEIKKKEKG